MSKKKKNKQTQGKKQILISRDGDVCQCCSVKVIYPKPHGCREKWPTCYGPLTIDHWIPKSKGGSNDIENLIILCEECNKIKGQHVMGMIHFKKAVTIRRLYGINVLI